MASYLRLIRSKNRPHPQMPLQPPRACTPSPSNSPTSPPCCLEDKLHRLLELRPGAAPMLDDLLNRLIATEESRLDEGVTDRHS